ncbi:MAG: 7-carboxy-7-deazaguanine synthase QueE [Planctomycetes bacterium]|nr:7-carboxy-7-deazaguanine synthase QueE [Planctomycetota bacterium]
MADPVFLEELFLSLQGEGAEVGRPQFFLRLGGCPLRCRYCDTPESWTTRARFRVHAVGGCREQANPLPAVELLPLFQDLAAGFGQALEGACLAVTGGEPLAQAEFLAEWLPAWPGPRMLETAGIWPQRLERLLPLLDSVSLDWKLESTLDRGAELLDPAGCVELLERRGTRYWVKLVLTERVEDQELAAALAALERRAPGAQVYLQPATAGFGGVRPPGAERLLRWSLLHRGRHLDLRVLPQVHPLLGAL